jgi:hypothetical protein
MVGKNSPSRPRLAEPVGEQQQPVARLEAFDPGARDRHETERRRRRGRLERDDLTSAAGAAAPDAHS